LSISDQIFAVHAEKPSVEPGEFINCTIDTIMVHEQLGSRIAAEFEQLKTKKLEDPQKLSIF